MHTILWSKCLLSLYERIREFQKNNNNNKDAVIKNGHVQMKIFYGHFIPVPSQESTLHKSQVQTTLPHLFPQKKVSIPEYAEHRTIVSNVCFPVIV